jgi:hypothetical protein
MSILIGLLPIGKATQITAKPENIWTGRGGYAIRERCDAVVIYANG